MNGPQIAFVGCIVTLAVTPLMILTARRTGIVDRPGTLKHQAPPVPYLGGAAVFAGLAGGVPGALCELG